MRQVEVHSQQVLERAARRKRETTWDPTSKPRITKKDSRTLVSTGG